MDDDQLVQRVLQGDGGAFSLLFDRYNPFICRVIYHVVRNQQDMEDVAESTWIKVWKTLSTLRDGASFKSWLKTIARREALDHIRKKDRRPEDSNEKEYEQLGDQIDIEEEVATAIAFEEAMEVALEQMRPEQTKCFHCHFQGWTVKAIAKQLGLTEGTAGTYISGAYRILYEELRQRLDGDQN